MHWLFVPHLIAQVMEDEEKRHEESELVVDDPLERHLLHEEPDGPAATILGVPRTLIAASTQLLHRNFKQCQFAGLARERQTDITSCSLLFHH